MYQDNHKEIGEHSSVAEELLSEIPELEQHCRAVQKSVAGGYFTLKEALYNYKVTEIEYIIYTLAKKNNELKKATKQNQFFITIGAIANVFHNQAASFDSYGKNVLNEIEGYSEEERVKVRKTSKGKWLKARLKRSSKSSPYRYKHAKRSR